MKNRNFRINLAKASHYWFFHFYFPHYVTFQTAEFHRQIFELTEKEDIGISVITAFRGSGKSTLCTLSYPLWAILGRQGKKFIVILSQTQRQARQYLMNIKRELEQNHLLSSDLGPFKEEPDEWGGFALVIPKYDARIMAASSEQGIRGTRYLQYRPDVIIADDIEDLQSVRTQDSRDKAYDWFKGDIIPSGSPNVKVIIIGNLLHEDGLLRRLQEEIDAEKLKGVYREYPLMDNKGVVAWPGRFPTQETIEEERQKIANDISWQREFMLKIIPADDQVVPREWIQYYDNDDFPSFSSDRYSWTKTGVDLAISLKQTADYTAMVTGSKFGRYGETKLYVHSFPVNARMDFPTALEKAELISRTANPNRKSTELLIEEVAYQEAFTQQLKERWIDARGVKINGMDKRSRLSLISHLIKNGVILFPKKGCEELINQIVGFGVEKHDDLMDAFVILAYYTMDNNRRGSFPGGKADRMGGSKFPNSTLPFNSFLRQKL